MKLVLERPRKKQVRVQPPTPAVNVTLLTFTADRRAAAAPLLLGAGHATIDRYLLPDGPTAANPPHAAAAADSWDRQTDKRMDTLPLHRPCRILCEQCHCQLYHGADDEFEHISITAKM